MNPEQWLSLKWNGGSTMSDRWLNQSKIIHLPHSFPHVNNFFKKSTHILLHKKSKSINPKNLTFFSYEAHSSFIVLFSPLTKHKLLFDNKF